MQKMGGRWLKVSKPYDAEHERLEVILLRNESRLNNHAQRIDNLERFQSGTEVQISNLVEQIKSLVNTIK